MQHPGCLAASGVRASAAGRDENKPSAWVRDASLLPRDKSEVRIDVYAAEGGQSEPLLDADRESPSNAD